MVTPTLVLVHGWGFDPALWQPLRAAMPEFAYVEVDLGFFGPARMPPWPVGPVVAVGHSLGLLWLLFRRPGPWAGLVSINGFPRFTSAPDYRPGVPPRVLDRMAQRCAENAAETVAAFRASCGAPGPLPAAPQAAQLCQGLGWLGQWDARTALASAGPTLALSGARDPILPAGMETHFPKAERHVHPHGGHLLPLEAAHWCADHLEAFIADTLP